MECDNELIPSRGTNGTHNSTITPTSNNNTTIDNDESWEKGFFRCPGNLKIPQHWLCDGERGKNKVKS
jgi:hypothetical protein